MTALQPAAVLATRYGRALDIAVVVILVSWDVVGAGSELVAHLSAYPSAALQAVLWGVLALAVAAGAVMLLRGGAGRAAAWTIAAVALAGSTAAAWASVPGQMLATDWAWGLAGWIGVLVLLRRPFAELAVFLSAEAVATLAVLADDGLHRLDLAGFVTILYAGVSIQVAVAIAARALDIPARQAAEAAAAEAAAAQQRLIADRVHAARQARWQSLHQTVEPLLQALAGGTADPGDPEVRQRCAVETARLRRLFAESDEVPDPLVHELHACADAAGQRGIAVDIESACGIPPIPPQARRALTDVAITVLTAARSRARITVTGADDGAAVSLVCDAPAGTPLPAPAGPMPAGHVTVDSQHDDEDLWVEARWSARSR